MDKFFTIVSRVLKIDSNKIDLSASRDSLREWDSLTHIKLLCEVEEEFGIDIPIEEIPSIRKLEDFLKYLEV
jgi:acyl carrier protein